MIVERALGIGRIIAEDADARQLGAQPRLSHLNHADLPECTNEAMLCP